MNCLSALARIQEYDIRCAADYEFHGAVMTHTDTENCFDTDDDVRLPFSSWHKACSPLWPIIQYEAHAFNLAQA